MVRRGLRRLSFKKRSKRMGKGEGGKSKREIRTVQIEKWKMKIENCSGEKVLDEVRWRGKGGRNAMLDAGRS